MVTQKGKGSSKGKRWTFFYLNEELHKTLRTDRTNNLLVAWNFKQEKRVAYVLADAYRRRQRAYSTGQVAKLMNREVFTIKSHMRKGNIRIPQAAYSLDGGMHRPKYFFSENDIREVHEFFRTLHRGRPRKDGLITTDRVVSKAELEALLRNETVLYTKTDDGEFVPVWKQPEW